MFCPKCSQQQIPDDARFCSRCGLPLEAVAQLVAADGQLPTLPHRPVVAVGATGITSARREGVRQGGKMMLSGMVIVPLLVLIHDALFLPEALPVAAAIICFIGGFVRLLYALVFQDGPLCNRRHPQTAVPPPLFAPASSPPAGRRARPREGAARETVAPAQGPLFGVPQRIDTAELYQPSSVTEHTTRLLRVEPAPEGPTPTLFANP